MEGVDALGSAQRVLSMWLQSCTANFLSFRKYKSGTFCGRCATRNSHTLSSFVFICLYYIEHYVIYLFFECRKQPADDNAACKQKSAPDSAAADLDADGQNLLRNARAVVSLGDEHASLSAKKVQAYEGGNVWWRGVGDWGRTKSR